MIDSKIIEKINSETNILDLVSNYISLEKRGKNFMGLCPFHKEKTPSFSVSPEKNICKCYGCGKGGSPITFYSQIENLSFENAAIELGKRLGIKVTNKPYDKNQRNYEIMDKATTFFEYALHNTKQGQNALKYLKERNLNIETIKKFRLGYATENLSNLYEYLKKEGYEDGELVTLGLVKKSEKTYDFYDLYINRLIFPIINQNNKVIAFSGRTMSNKNNIKYFNSPETPIFKKGFTVYNINEGLKKAEEVILYEGFFDVIKSTEAGLSNAIATMGTALTNEQVSLIKSFNKNITICYDGDSAGTNATLQALPKLRKQKLNINIVSLPKNQDPDDFIDKNGKEEFIKYFKENKRDYYSFIYDYYRKNLNIKNANDVQNFIKNITSQFIDSPKVIIQMYENKISKLLGIDFKFNFPRRVKPTFNEENRHQVFMDDNKIPIRKGELQAETAKNAEYKIVYNLITTPKNIHFIQTKLKPEEYYSLLAAEIRIAIEDYYNINECIDLKDLSKDFNQEQKDYINDVINKGRTIADPTEEDLLALMDEIRLYSMIRPSKPGKKPDYNSIIKMLKKKNEFYELRQNKSKK